MQKQTNPMDPELKEAAMSGDVSFLREAITSKPPDYFLSLSYLHNGDNILHLATLRGHVKFLKAAMDTLAAEVILVLLSQLNGNGDNPLHSAAYFSRLEIIRLILGYYRRSYTPTPDDDLPHRCRPWLALNKYSKQTPLHCALSRSHEEIAMEIMSMDMELLCDMVDADGNSPLFLAVKKGCNQVAENILRSSFSYSLCGADGFTPLHVAPRSSDVVLRLLLAKHEDLFDVVGDEKSSVLHYWLRIDEVWALNLILEEEYPGARSKVFRDLITSKDIDDETPLHIASRKDRIEFGRTLVQGILQEIRAAAVTPAPCPWKMQNKTGNTPLHIALLNDNEHFVFQFLSCQILNNRGQSPLFLALFKKQEPVVEEILKTQDLQFRMLRNSDGVTVLHLLPSCSENLGKRLLQKFWWMMKLRDDNGKTALHEAKKRNIAWLVNSLTNPSLIQKEPFDWIKACERPDEAPAVRAFIDTCDDLQAVCSEQNDTPLHHIRLQTYGDYVNFVKIPSITELKNEIDAEGATPLHRALQRKDMHLAKILLIDNGVERNIKDDFGYTAMDLLAKLCQQNQDWSKMGKQIKVNPYLRTSYIQPGTNLGEMRNTLSVVAALLSTITFAAGFTLPGGLKSETGDAVLAKNAAFLVFLLSDAYAMCTSMLVLFCLIWSMVSTREMSYFLVDRSVLILMQALYGTMLAFMTGIYAVIAHRSLWAAIVIFIMCILIGVLTHRTVLHHTLSKFIPATDPNRGRRTKNENRDLNKLLEEGRASGSGDDR